MIKTILFDLCRVILFPKDPNYGSSLNDLYEKLTKDEQIPFFNYFKLNEDLLQWINDNKKNYQMAIFTSRIIQNDPQLREKIDHIFNKIISAQENSVNKNSKESYLFVSKKLNNKPNEIIYIDDNLSNIDNAKNAGFDVILFKTNKQIINEIKTKLSKYE